MSIQFKIFTENSGYFDRSAPEAQSLFEQLAALLERKPRHTQALGALKKMLQANPDFFPAYLEMAYVYIGRQNPRMALESAQRGIALAHQLLPDGYTGLLEWRHPENHPYLEMLLIGMLSNVQLGQHQAAAKMGELILARDPDDMQGISAVLASEALRAGNTELARKLCLGHAAKFPILHYELGLIYMLEKDWVAAATSLRRGFVEMPYFQEHFRGLTESAPRVYHHASKFHHPEAAKVHMDTYGELWARNIDGLLFMDWLYDHPAVTAERAHMIECLEAMLWEDGGDPATLGRRYRERFEAIDDTLSRQIVRPRTPHGGLPTLPWRYEH